LSKISEGDVKDTGPLMSHKSFTTCAGMTGLWDSRETGLKKKDSGKTGWFSFVFSL